MSTPWTELPLWVGVLACGAAAQLVKAAVYSATSRQTALAALGQSHGLPSLPAAILGTLLVLTVLREGWYSAEAGFALVFAVIVVHDTVKLRLATSRQREVLHDLVADLPGAGPLHRAVAEYLDPTSHHPAHVAVGVLFGALFALAFGLPPR